MESACWHNSNVDSVISLGRPVTNFSTGLIRPFFRELKDLYVERQAVCLVDSETRNNQINVAIRTNLEIGIGIAINCVRLCPSEVSDLNFRIFTTESRLEVQRESLRRWLSASEVAFAYDGRLATIEESLDCGRTVKLRIELTSSLPDFFENANLIVIDQQLGAKISGRICSDLPELLANKARLILEDDILPASAILIKSVLATNGTCRITRSPKFRFFDTGRKMGHTCFLANKKSISMVPSVAYSPENHYRVTNFVKDHLASYEKRRTQWPKLNQ